MQKTLEPIQEETPADNRLPPLERVGLGVTILVGTFFALRWAIGRLGLPWAALLPAHSIPNSPESFWEMMGAIAGLLGIFVSAAVGIVAYKGLRAVRLTQQDIKTRVARETATCTIARLEELANELLPEHAKVVSKLTEHGVQPFRSAGRSLRFDSAKPDPADLAAARDWSTKLPPEVLNLCWGLLNRLEAWASYFLHGLADEKLAVEPAGPILRGWVLRYYPLIVVARADPGKGNFVNLVALYRSWTSAMDEQMMQRQVEEVRQQYLAKLEERHQAKLPRPLGSDID